VYVISVISGEMSTMTDKSTLMIQRDLDDIKLQVKKELDTIRDLLDSQSFRNPSIAWNAPYQIHRLRRAMRIHYLALKIRDSSPVNPSTRELFWDLKADVEFP
jgi:hypothetical protein